MSSRGPAGDPRLRSSSSRLQELHLPARARLAASATRIAEDAAQNGASRAVEEDVLAAAADRVAALWQRRDTGDLFMPVDLRGELEAVVGLVAAALNGAPLPVPGENVERVVRRRLTDLLRSELLEIFGAASRLPAAEEMLPLLRAVEEVRRLFDSEWDDDPAALLASPDGLMLVSEVAHDLRSPLTAVLFLADNLYRGHSGPLNEVQARQIGIVYSAALGLVEVTSDLMALSRAPLAARPSEARPFSLLEMLESVRGVVQPMAEEKGLELRIHADRPDTRLGHPIPLQRSLLNLATNALKFTDTGSVEITATAVDAERVRFDVVDTGRGMTDEERRRLFEPFRRRPHHGQAFSGTGLGLMIVRRMVAALDAQLELESTPGVGTRFHFTLSAPPVSQY
jgi:signal transduction histidine kinase